MFPINKYYSANGINDACLYLDNHSDAKIILGGPDVLIRLREGKPGFSHLVDVQGLPELTQLNKSDDGVITIGSGVCFSDLIHFLKEHQLCAALIEGASSVGGPQVRNMATIGGNICNGAPSADSAAPLLALNATLTIESTQGSRHVAVESFYKGPGKVHLETNELVTAITITPENYHNTGSHFYKYAMRKAMDIATIGCAAVCTVEDNYLTGLNLAYTVAAPVPTRCRNAERIACNQPVSKSIIRDIAGTVLDDLSPRNSWRAGKKFREHLIRTLAHRVVSEAITRAGGKVE